VYIKGVMACLTFFAGALYNGIAIQYGSTSFHRQPRLTRDGQAALIYTGDFFLSAKESRARIHSWEWSVNRVGRAPRAVRTCHVSPFVCTHPHRSRGGFIGKTKAVVSAGQHESFFFRLFLF
jgi:hypothetical protein